MNAGFLCHTLSLVRETANSPNDQLLLSEQTVSYGTKTCENWAAQADVCSKNSCLQFGPNASVSEVIPGDFQAQRPISKEGRGEGILVRSARVCGVGVLGCKVRQVSRVLRTLLWQSPKACVQCHRADKNRCYQLHNSDSEGTVTTLR